MRDEGEHKEQAPTSDEPEETQQAARWASHGDSEGPIEIPDPKPTEKGGNSIPPSN